MRTLTLQQFHDECKAQGVPTLHIAVKCPMCKTEQSGADLIRAGVGADFDAIEKYLAFSCVGRFTNGGEHKPGEAPGRGCNWTLGGFFKLHQLEVVTEDGVHHARFELATPEEAQAHKAANEERATTERGEVAHG